VLAGTVHENGLIMASKINRMLDPRAQPAQLRLDRETDVRPHPRPQLNSILPGANGISR
jgi:hypothetical protein